MEERLFPILEKERKIIIRPFAFPLTWDGAETGGVHTVVGSLVAFDRNSLDHNKWFSVLVFATDIQIITMALKSNMV